MYKSSVLVFYLLAPAFSLVAQTTLSEKSFIKLVTHPTGETTVEVGQADIDGDGKADIIAANYGGQSISILLNNSNAGNVSLAPCFNIAASGRVTAVQIADLNGDGKAEIVASIEQSAVAVYENKSIPGTLDFGPELSIATGNYAVDVSIADIDIDGFPDIAVLNNQSSTVSIYSNEDKTGGISLQQKASVRTSGSNESLIFADLNDDSRPDMITTNYFASSLSVFINSSENQTLSFEGNVELPIGAVPTNVAAGDVNGDNKPDLVVGHSNKFTFSVLVNKSSSQTASFLEKQNFSTGYTPRGISIADLDNDGKADVATGNYSDNSVSIFVNLTAASSDSILFGPMQKYDNAESPYDLMVMDVDLDGRKDLITANFSSKGSVSIFNNRIGAPQVTLPVISSFAPGWGGIGTVVKIYGTGFGKNISENRVYFGSIEATILSATATEVMVEVPAGASDALISVVHNSFAGFSSVPFNVTFPGSDGGIKYNVDFFNVQSELSADNPRTIKFADFDGDNKPDIVFTQQGTDKLTIHRNTSSRGLIAYSDKTDLQTGSDPFDMAIADFNGDGKYDIAVTSFNSGNASTVSVFKNTSSRGKISFVSGVTFSAGNGANGIISSDFDFDGKVDLGVSSGNSGYIYYFKNTGGNSNISFVPLQDVRNLYHARVSAHGDIDGDGIADVVHLNFSNASITVSVNDGLSAPPLFASTANFTVGAYPNDAVVGDLDNDGKLDILVTSYEGSVSILRNGSSLKHPAFESVKTMATGKSPLAVNLGDLDGDGRLDIIIPSDEPGKVGIYKNLSTPGTIRFGEVVYLRAGFGPTDVACGDIDGDGKTDLAIGNGYNRVTIVRNTFGEAMVLPSGSNPVYGAITQSTIYDSAVNTHRGQAYVQRHYEVTPVNNPDRATGTITLYFRQSDFDAFNAHPDHGVDLPMSPTDSAGIANLRVYQYHGTSTEGIPGSYSGSSVVINPDDAKIVWDAQTQWWDVSFEVNGFSGFFVSVEGDGMSEQNQETRKLLVFPNPTSGRIVVQHPASTAAFIRVFDMRGNLARMVIVKNNVSQTEIDLPDLSTGVYNVVWQSGGSVRVSRLVVK